MKKKVIAIIGKAGHGKDESVKYLVKHCSKKCEHVSFAKLLKEQAKYLGWNGKKDKAGRTFLQELSLPVKRYFSELAKVDKKYSLYADGNFYSGYVLKQIKESEKEIFFISDMRFVCEYELFANDKDIDLTVIRVWRHNKDKSNFDNGLTYEQQNHPSETENLKIPCRYIVRAYNVESLHKELDEVVLKDNIL